MSAAKKFFEAGRSWEKEGNIKEALKNYHAAIKSDPDYRPAYMNLGSLYSRSGKPDTAIGFYRRALELKDDAAVNFNLGSDSFRLGHLTDSRKYLIHCLKHDSRMIRAHILLAYIYGKEHNYDRAFIYFRNALKIEPSNRTAILGYAVALSENEEYEKALTLLESGRIDLSKDPTLKNLHAGLLLKLGRLSESLKEINELTKTSSGYISFTDHLKKARQEKDDEFQKTFAGIDDKINERMNRVRKRITDKKSAGLKAEDDTTEEELKDLVDLSFLHLFQGDTEKALKFLFQAQKMGKKE
jgi:tetratricopeptide (TPR) repeat protein